MHRRRFGPHLLPACLLAALAACAGDTGNDGTTQGTHGDSSAYLDDEYQPGRFPVEAEILDGIRCRLAGNCDDGSTPNTGGSSASTGIPRHGDPPRSLGSGSGPYRTSYYEIRSGRVYYPRDAPAPYAGLSLCGGFLNTGWEFTDWGGFYASWGIVTVITWTGSLDTPSIRGYALSSAIRELKTENSNSRSPIAGKMSDRYGTSGYSMGGGGTTVSSAADSTLKVSIGMAPWSPSGTGVRVPSLFICGSTDAIASCSSHAAYAYRQVSSSVPKMLAMVSGGHLSWFSPSAGWGAGGGLALAFAKVFLEGDERWKAPLISHSAVYETNIR